MAPTGEMPGRLGSDSVTTTPFLAWVDSLAWTEQTALLRAALREEGAYLDDAMSRAVRSPSRLEEAAHDFQVAAADHTKFAVWTVPSVKPAIWIRPNHLGGGGVTWGWINQPGRGIDCGDLCWDPETGCVAYTVDASKGRERYTLKVTRADGRTWSHGRSVGSAVAIQGGRVVVQEEVSPLRTQRVVSLDLETGRGRAILYEERDPETALTLVRGEHGAVFILGDRAGLHTLRLVRGGRSVQRLSEEGVSFVPIGQRRPGGEPIYLVRRGRIDAPWTAVGVSWRLGRIGRSVRIEFASAAAGVAISKDAGLIRVWALNSRTEPRLLGSQFGAIFVNSWDLFSLRGGGGDAATVGCHAVQPGCNLQIGTITSRAFTVSAPEAYARTEVGFARSKDGEAVRWILVRPLEGPVRGIVVSGYGAYGLPTVADTVRWRPWLEAGWAIAFALVRGGGDGAEAWAFKGKMGGKERAIDDYEAVVRAVQARTRLGPEATCLFGRSAGGLLIGGAVARNPDGQLARLVYTEVPYVDLLKTASNPALPLTPFEYHEFANPRAGPVEFAEALALSPVHRLGAAGAPGVRVLCRTALNDVQVYPYEALKWILRLRGKRAAPDGKYLRVETGEGHFSRGLRVHMERAEDFLLVTSWL